MRGRGIRGCILDQRDVHTHIPMHVRGCRCDCFCCIYYPQWYEVSRKRFNVGLKAVFRLLLSKICMLSLKIKVLTQHNKKDLRLRRI